MWTDRRMDERKERRKDRQTYRSYYLLFVILRTAEKKAKTTVTAFTSIFNRLKYKSQNIFSKVLLVLLYK